MYDENAIRPDDGVGECVMPNATRELLQTITQHSLCSFDEKPKKTRMMIKFKGESVNFFECRKFTQSFKRIQT